MKRCPKCNKAYSDIMDHCPDCNISLPGNASASSDVNSGLNKPHPQQKNDAQNQYQQQNTNVNQSQPQQNQNVQSGQRSQSTGKVVCSKCGTVNDADSKFCCKCGNSIGNQYTDRNNRKASVDNPNASQQTVQPQSTQKTFCGYCGMPVEDGAFCSNCGAKVSKKANGFADSTNKVKKSGNKKKLFIGIGIGIAVVILAIIVISLLTSDTVDHSCDWCGRSPSVAYEKADGSSAYVCTDCSKECKLCGDKASKHYENLMGMMVFVCDDCYEKVKNN